MHRIMYLWLIVAFFVVPAACFAQTGTVTVTVTKSSVSPCTGGTDTHFYNGGDPISLNLPFCATRVNVTTSGTSVNIGSITLTGGPTNTPLDIVIGSGALSQSDTLPPQIGNDWAGLDVSAIASGVETRLAGGIGGNLTGSIGVKQLFRIDVGGQVQAAITATNPGNFGGVCAVEAGSIGTGGSITLTNGPLLRVLTTGSGDIAREHYGNQRSDRELDRR
ncbi:MAG: hypothetical protein H7Y88_01400 [Phycisphaerales bacterium]|nr:hypothetical protein [Phycisphaerales bacterium]